MSTRGFIDSEAEQIYFESWGHAEETVVLVHGMGGSHAVWYQQVPYLLQEFRVVTWDQRGFGRSTNDSEDIGPVPAVRDLLGLLDHLEVEQAHIVGQSMGGWSALGFAIDHPDRVASLTLADTIAGIFTPEIRQSLLDYAVRAGAGVPPDHLPLGEHPAVGTQLLDEDLAQSFLYSELGSLTDPPTPMEIMPLLMTTDHTARAPEVDAPTLFIVGEFDPIFAPPLIRAASKFIAGSELAVVQNTGHSPYFERPALWNNIVAGFLQQSSP